MTKINILILKKSLIVATALLLGALMPYLSRIPNAFIYGFSWIWSYQTTYDNFLWWNGLHLGSLIPIFIFGLVFVTGNIRWAFYASALIHFAATCFFYHDHGVIYHPDNFLGFIVYPYLIGIPSFLCGLIGLFAELIVNGRKEKQKGSENKENERLV